MWQIITGSRWHTTGWLYILDIFVKLHRTHLSDSCLYFFLALYASGSHMSPLTYHPIPTMAKPKPTTPPAPAAARFSRSAARSSRSAAQSGCSTARSGWRLHESAWIDMHHPIRPLRLPPDLTGAALSMPRLCMRRLLAVLAAQLGTPRGRCDEHSGKFPSIMKPRFNRPVEERNQFWRLMLAGFWHDALPASAATWNMHTTQPKYFAPTCSEVVNLTGLL
jgi:hypothetical protein